MFELVIVLNIFIKFLRESLYKQDGDHSFNLGTTNFFYYFRMARHLTKLQIASCTVWVLAVLYFVWKYFCGVQERLQYSVGGDLFAAGWMGPFNRIDISDLEWASAKVIARYYFLAIIVQNIVLHSTPKFAHVQLRCLLSLAFLTITLGCICSATLLSIFALTWAMSRLGRKYLIYALSLVILYVVVYRGGLLHVMGAPPPEEQLIVLIFDIGVSWSCLRALSLGLALIDDEVDLMSALCYFLYIPSFCTGPLVNCKDFTRQLQSASLPNKRDAIKLAAISTMRIGMWVILLELMDHVLFTSAAVLDYKLIREHMSLSEYFGFTLVMMARFYLKYLILYGVGEEAARLEGIWLPERPRCTLRLTSGGQVWRTFDRGLYLWFIEYIYAPLGGGIVAAVSCFVFASFWHASSPSVQVWATMNFVLVVTERILAKSLSSGAWIIAQVPLHWLAVGSNMFYLGDYDIGMDFFTNLFSSLWVLIIAFCISLCACVVGRHFQEKDRLFYKKKHQARE